MEWGMRNEECGMWNVECGIIFKPLSKITIKSNKRDNYLINQK